MECSYYRSFWGCTTCDGIEYYFIRMYSFRDTFEAFITPTTIVDCAVATKRYGFQRRWGSEICICDQDTFILSISFILYHQKLNSARCLYIQEQPPTVQMGCKTYITDINFLSIAFLWTMKYYCPCKYFFHKVVIRYHGYTDLFLCTFR